MIESQHSPARGRVRQPSRAERLAVERIRLMLLHARELFRTSLARLLESEAGIELAGECANVDEALQSLPEAQPDVILFDFAIWRDLVFAARDAGYQGKFLAIAEEMDAASCARALSHGVSGVVLSSDSPTHLVQAIRVVASGGGWVDQSVLQLLADRYPHHEDIRLDTLAEREQAVLRGVLGGLTNRKIADQIGTSEATVKATLQQLFNRTGVRTRSQLVRILLAEEAAVANQTDNPAA
jgi:DNA-binding NarL/FixJ family response regulator